MNLNEDEVVQNPNSPGPCHMCGRTVPHFFQHVASDCTNWPEEIPPECYTGITYKYKKHVVYFERKPIAGFDWSYYHEDFDGEGDSRYGHAPTFYDCLMEIDEKDEDEYD